MSFTENESVVSLYVVRAANQQYFGGYDAQSRKAIFVESPLHAKKFTNKYDVKLRPEETLVEISVDLEKSQHTISSPFRPQLKKKPSFSPAKE